MKKQESPGFSRGEQVKGRQGLSRGWDVGDRVGRDRVMTGTYEIRPSGGVTDRTETVPDADLFAAGRAAGIAETEHITQTALTFLRTRTTDDGRDIIRTALELIEELKTK